MKFSSIGDSPSPSSGKEIWGAHHSILQHSNWERMSDGMNNNMVGCALC